MKKILLCMRLLCGLTSSVDAMSSEEMSFFYKSMNNIPFETILFSKSVEKMLLSDLKEKDIDAARVYHKVIQDRSEEEMSHFIRMCPYQTQLEFYKGDFNWDRTDVNVYLQENHEKTTLLAVAIKGNCPHIAKYLINRGARIAQEDSDGLFPIHLATLYNSPEIADLLIRRGAFINQTDSSGRQIQPLHLAVIINSVEMVELLLSRGASVKGKTKNSNTPMHYASSRRYSGGSLTTANVEIIDKLINSKVDVNAKNNDKNTPLHLLARENSPLVPEIVEKLVKAGADLNAKDNFGNTPLHLSINNNEITRVLAEAGTDLNAKDSLGNTPLHLCTNDPTFCHETVEILINNGADVNIQNVDKNTPLHLLATQNSPIAPKVAKILIDNGAYLRLRNKKGDTVFDVARKHNNRSLMDFFETTILAAPNCSEEEFSRFLKECSPEHANHFDWGELDVNAEIPIKLGKVIFMESWLNIATKAGCPNIVQYLIDRGADVNRVDSVGATPIYTAICNGFTEIVGILINNGADIKQKFSPTGIQPLHCAVINNFSEIVKLLLFYNADVNAEIVPESTLIDSGSHNSTALHLSMFNANRKESIEVIRTLLENGADATAQDRKGNTPLHILLTNSRGIKMSILHEITKMLLANRDVKMKLLNLKNKDGKTICDIAKKTENQELISLL